MGEPGKLIEEEVLGETNREARELPIEEKEHFSIEHHFKATKDYQPFKDASNPVEKPFPCQVLKNMAKELQVNPKQLRFYTSVGYPPLDYHKERKIDSWVELDLGAGRYARTTWDITTKKGVDTEDKKAEVIIEWPKDGLSSTDKEDEKEWGEQINTVTEKSLEALRKNTEAMGEVVRPLNDFEIEESRRMRAEEDGAKFTNATKIEEKPKEVVDERKEDIKRRRLLERQSRKQNRRRTP